MWKRKLKKFCKGFVMPVLVVVAVIAMVGLCGGMFVLGMDNYIAALDSRHADMQQVLAELDK